MSCAKDSKPTVAFTKSRRINLAVSGSPSKNSVTASSSIACAKAGSFCTRATTVSLKSRVSAISHSFQYLSLASLVVFPQNNRLIDVILLPLLAPTTQQDNDLQSVFRQIDA